MDDYFEGMNLNFAEAPLLSKINDNSSAFFQSEVVFLIINLTLTYKN